MSEGSICEGVTPYETVGPLSPAVLEGLNAGQKAGGVQSQNSAEESLGGWSGELGELGETMRVYARIGGIVLGCGADGLLGMGLRNQPIFIYI